MIGLLIKGIFWVINKVASLILAPLLGLLNVFVFGNISPLLVALLTLVVTMSKYVLLITDLLCIPRELFYIFFSVILGVLAWVINARAIMFGMAIYRHFKP